LSFSELISTDFFNKLKGNYSPRYAG
jgi:hypothetical protein